MLSNDAKNAPQRRVESLLVLLERLEGLHLELRAVLDDKLESMRKSDMETLQDCVERESVLTTRISEQEGLRKQLMERICRGYGIASQTARRLPARRLADRLDEPQRGKINAMADRLKAAVMEVSKLNALIGRVSSQILKYLGEIFTEVRGAEASPVVYSKYGQTAAARPVEIFEAVG